MAESTSSNKGRRCPNPKAEGVRRFGWYVRDVSSGLNGARLRGSERRTQILSAARAEFIARGLTGVRVQEVADAAGVASGLIYKHFESKEALFHEAVIAPLEVRIGEQIEAMRALPDDPDGSMHEQGGRAWILEVLRFFTEVIDGLGVALFSERDEGRDFYTAHLHPIMQGYLEAGQVNLPRWPHRDYDVDTLVHMIFGTAFWISLDASMRARAEHLEQRADLIADIVLYGMTPRDKPGRRQR